MRKLILLVTIISLLTACGIPGSGLKKAYLIVINANTYTVNNNFDKAESFAIRDGKFVGVGTNDEIQNKFIASKTVDAKNQTVAIFSVRALEMADHALSWPPERDLLQRPSFSLCRSVHLFAAHFVDVACMHSQHLWLYSFDQSMS